MNSESNSSSSSRTSTATRSCRICNANVRPRKNYTPNICEACQKFFRRNVTKFDDLMCSTGQFNCNVQDGRRWCAKCRFEKCLRFGMKSKFLKFRNRSQSMAMSTREGSEVDKESVELSMASSPLAVTNCPQSPVNVDLGQISNSLPSQQLNLSPADPTLDAAERFLKASFTAYTELSGVEKVCPCFFF